MPSVSAALALMTTVAPAVNVAPLPGAVIDTVGGRLPVLPTISYSQRLATPSTGSLNTVRLQPMLPVTPPRTLKKPLAPKYTSATTAAVNTQVAFSLAQKTRVTCRDTGSLMATAPALSVTRAARA